MNQSDFGTEKRFLLISSNSSGRGGGERYLVFLTQGLKLLGIDVHVLLSDVTFMDDWEHELVDAGAVVHRCRLKGLVHRPLRFIQSVFDTRQQQRIASVCKDIHPSAILVNQQYDEDGLDYLAGALAANVCTVAGVIHMPMTAGKNARPLGQLRGAVLRYWYKKNPYKIVCSSSGGEAEFASFYGPNLDTSVVVSGVPLSSDRIDRHKTIERLDDEWITASMNRTKPRLPMIGVACQFVPQKNLPLLIDGWLAASQAGTQTRLLLIGDGPEREQIERRLSETDSSLWHVTGWTEKYADYLAHLDVFVMPSHYEGLPLTLIEVAGMGVPAIIANFNGAAEIAEKAFWVERLKYNTPQELGRRIACRVKALEEYPPASQAERNRFIEYFSPLRMAKDFLGLFGASE